APPPARKAPWPARSEASANVAPSAELMRFEIEPRARADVALPTHESAPRGVFRVARGTLDVDPYDLMRTRGSVEIDLASISMDTDDPEQRHRYTVQAQNWLDLGSSRPEAERERLRWARFEIKSVS